MNQLSLGAEISIFLIGSIISLYVFAVLLRLLLGFARADFHNPLSQVIVSVTNPVLKPLRRFIPAIGQVDTAAVLLAYGLTFVKNIIVSLIAYGSLNIPHLLFKSVGDLLIGVVWIYIAFLVIGVIFSWMGNTVIAGNPLYSLTNSLTKPMLRPLNKYIPTIGGFSFSAFIAILLLNVLLMVLTPIFA